MSHIAELEYVSVSQHAAEIGCSMPEIAVMPDNFPAVRSHGELRVRRDAVALRSILENANFPLGSFCAAAEHATFGEEDFMHWEASLFVSASLLKREPYVVAVALTIVRDHLTDYFAAEPGRATRFSLVVERNDRTCRKLVYEGDIAGLRSLAQMAGRLAEE
jgi:hypothetical protein